MDVTKKKWGIAFITWMLLVPIGSIITFHTFPAEEVDWLNMALLFGLLVVTMILPLHLSDVTVSLERWITFAVFLQYGAFAELVFTQIAMVILLFSGKSAFPKGFRFMVNSILFTFISMASGAIFHLFGGEVGMTGFMEVVLFGLFYAISYTFINLLLLAIFFEMMSRSYSIFNKGAIGDYAVTIVVFPFSVALYFLSGFLGDKAILLIGIPFVFVIMIARMYLRSDRLGEKLSSASVIGHELAERLGFEDVIHTFLVKLKEVLPFDHGYVLDVHGKNHLHLLMASEDGSISKEAESFAFKPEWISDDGVDQMETRIYRTRKEAVQLTSFTFSQAIECVMVAPIQRNGKTEGILVLNATKKNAFQQLEMKIVDILTGYLAIALVKARLYEKTIEKSERCGLTKLYNYRYLDTYLEKEIDRFQTGEIESLSLLILDIDHFKSINDTYGHQSGNDLLIALATILQNYMPPDVTIARYGGEEFVLVLSDVGNEDAIAIAEVLRSEVESTIFRIVSDLSETRASIDVRMTISIGVATVPEDAEDAKELLRNADRALYIGGKQAGRNRVGVYGQGKVGMV